MPHIRAIEGVRCQSHQAWVVMCFSHIVGMFPHREAFHRRSYSREALSAVAEGMASEATNGQEGQADFGETPAQDRAMASQGREKLIARTAG